MDWPTIINEILWMEEITEKHLCLSLTSKPSFSNINQIKKGLIRRPNYDLGNELIQRHKRLKKEYQNKQAII